MADESEPKSSVPLPPKLDLRKAIPPAAAAPRPTIAPGQAAASTPAAPSGSESSTTMHIKLSDDTAGIKIMSPAVTVSAPGPTIVQPRPTPTVEVKRPVLQQPSAAPTLTVKPLTVAPPAAAAQAPTPKLSSKSETSRIPLELATPAAPGGIKPSGDLKTIKIKPTQGGPSVRVGGPAPAAAAQPSAADKASDDKRKTSRISLEAALAMEDKGGDKGGAPKTIRLKRPGETTGKVAPTLDTIKADPGASKAAMSQTARLDEQLPEDEEGPTPTRRKTIKVKRPGMAAAPGGEEVAAAVEAAEPERVVALPAAKTGIFDWIAVAVALITMIMTFVVMMMLASQAWGPNSCLTELSSWKTGPDIGWAGKTPPMAQ